MKCRFHPIGFVDFLTYQEWSTGEPQAPVVHVGPWEGSQCGAGVWAIYCIFGGQGVGLRSSMAMHGQCELTNPQNHQVIG